MTDFLMPAMGADMESGTIVQWHVRPGDRVRAGERLATIVHAPGEPDGALDIVAPQAGYILTRRRVRFLEAGGDVIKLVGERPSAAHRPGALESR